MFAKFAKFVKISLDFGQIVFGSQKCRKWMWKWNFENGKWVWYKKKHFERNYSTEVENTYACLTWEAPRKIPAEQKTDPQAVQRNFAGIRRISPEFHEISREQAEQSAVTKNKASSMRPAFANNVRARPLSVTSVQICPYDFVPVCSCQIPETTSNVRDAVKYQKNFQDGEQ